MQKFKENIYLAVQGLKSNKIRALLTMLGIIIGIGSVIAIVTVGNALTSAVTGELSGMGVTAIQIIVTEKGSNYTGFGPPQLMGQTPREEDYITDDMIEKFREVNANEIESIGLSYNIGAGKVEDKRKYANVYVSAYNDEGDKVDNLDMVNGRFIRTSDIKSRRNVCVVSDKLVENMFKKSEDPIGKEVKLSVNGTLQSFYIIGVYKYVKNSFNPHTGADKDVQTAFYVPLSLNKQLSNNAYEGYRSFVFNANPDSDVKKVSADAKKFFNKFYTKNKDFQISTIEMETLLDSVTTMLNTINIAISVIAGISLLVGGIGVMNIMLVSVTERTREIGTRKALGAKNSDILQQFIVEAVIICMIGGAIGIVVGLIAGDAGAKFMGYPSEPSVTSILIAVIFSTIIGVFFGFYPAQKASNLDPIDALRYE